MRKLFLSLLVALAPLAASLAQVQDAEGCKDHPLLTRMPNYSIEECSKNFDAADLPIAPEKTRHVEGDKTFFRYAFDVESGKPIPSKLQVTRNYQNALAKLGGKMVAQVDEEPVFKLSRSGKDVWVFVHGFYSAQGSGITNYCLIIVEEEAMKQEISANDIFDALEKEGFIALQINFDTGKSTIKAESQSIVDQITQMLKAHPELKVSIEGHTDNVGQPTANKTLSGQRAQAVVAALKGKGIGAARLSSVGWGQEKPVADNRSEAGRAQNRRVEIVKK